MTDELGTPLGLGAFVFLSVVGVARCVGRVKGRLSGVERSVERLRADWRRLRPDMNRLRDDIGRLRSHVEAILLRFP